MRKGFDVAFNRSSLHHFNPEPFFLFEVVLSRRRKSRLRRPSLGVTAPIVLSKNPALTVRSGVGFFPAILPGEFSASGG
jgi:hypothetical protein